VDAVEDGEAGGKKVAFIYIFTLALIVILDANKT
jgi:hypothetical protein